MYINKSKLRNTTIFYLVKSFRDPITKKVSTKTVERIGTVEEIKEKIGNTDIDKWLKDYAKRRTEEEKNKVNKKIVITLNKNNKTSQTPTKLRNAGFLYIKKACREIGLDIICKKIQNKENLKYDLFSVFMSVLYNKILNTKQEVSSLYFSKTLIETPNFTSKNLNQSMSIFAKYYLDIQEKLYNNIKNKLHLNNTKIFYDCLNYSIINDKIGNFHKGKHPKNIVTLTKNFYDEHGFPIMFTLESSLNKQYDDFIKIKDYLITTYPYASLYYFPECLFSSTDSILLNLYKKKHKLNFQKIKNMEENILNWIIDPKGWHVCESDRLYNLNTIKKEIKNKNLNTVDREILKDQIYYKNRQFYTQKTNKSKKQKNNLIALFNYSLGDWHKNIRRNTIINVQKTMEQTNVNSIKDRYRNVLYNETINIDNKNQEVFYFDSSSFKSEKLYDGYYLITGLFANEAIYPIVDVMSTRINQIDYILYYVKKDFVSENMKTLLKNLISHYLISYVAVSVLKYMFYKIDKKFSIAEIVNALNTMNFLQINEEGWLSTFNSSDIINTINKKFDIDINKQSIDTATIKSLCK